MQHVQDNGSVADNSASGVILLFAAYTVRTRLNHAWYASTFQHLPLHQAHAYTATSSPLPAFAPATYATHIILHAPALACPFASAYNVTPQPRGRGTNLPSMVVCDACMYSSGRVATMFAFDAVTPKADTAIVSFSTTPATIR